MNYVYTYRSSDGRRHTGEIEAASRDEAYGMLRTQGIRAIRVDEVRTGAKGGPARRIAYVVAVLAGVAAIGGGAAAWLLRAQSGGAEEPGVEAMPRPRHKLEARIPVEAVFKDPTERWLAVFAEPGREERERVDDFHEGAFTEAMSRPVMIDAKDPPPFAELKRIVAGEKEEAAMRLRGGWSEREVAAWFVARQRMEVEFRKLLERRVKAGETTREEADRELAAIGMK